MSRDTSHTSDQPFSTPSDVAIIASDSLPPSHSLLGPPTDISILWAEHTPPATIGTNNPVGDALKLIMHAIATTDPLIPPSEPPASHHY